MAKEQYFVVKNLFERLVSVSLFLLKLIAKALHQDAFTVASQFGAVFIDAQHVFVITLIAFELNNNRHRRKGLN